MYAFSYPVPQAMLPDSHGPIRGLEPHADSSDSSDDDQTDPAPPPVPTLPAVPLCDPHVNVAPPIEHHPDRPARHRIAPTWQQSGDWIMKS